MNNLNYRSRYFTLTCFISFVLLIGAKCHATDLERPFIWLTDAETKQINEKIKIHSWANKRFQQLKHRSDEFAPKSLVERIENIQQLPLAWSDQNKQTDQFPAFILQKNVGNNHLRFPLQTSLQAAIDCSILYQLTEQERYAHCGADILYTVTQALMSTPISDEEVRLSNRGWIVPENHLLESRIYSAQIPLIYDLLYPYLKNGGTVYDVNQQKLVAFDFKAAQQVFITYAQMALDSGLVDNNWPVLESSSLVHNALAIDDKALRQHYLNHYLSIDTPHQDSLAKVAKSYVNAGDIWPESLNYSMHVAYFSLYLMTLIDRIEPELALGKKYPHIAAALLANEQLRFPNGDYPAFGDGNRRYHDNFLEFEIAYKSALLNHNQLLSNAFANELKHAIDSGKYDRAKLLARNTGASPYFSPLELLWAEPDLGEQKSHETFNAYTSVDVPFAGFFIQRNLNTQDKVNHGLMATIGGGSYVHGHASGIDMELYGQGHVLGVEAGKGVYVSEIHQNYNRLFAGHNTVISNGASASKGDWINLGINRVKTVAIEPEVRTAPISDKYSFVTVGFHDEHNLVKEAYHQRTTALIRLSDKHGYYLDIFRAKSDTPNQYHDYLYRNLADAIEVSSEGKDLPLFKNKQGFQPFDRSIWKQDRHFAHPGWQYFSEVKTSHLTNHNVDVVFHASGFSNSPVQMKTRIVEGLDLTVSTAKAPKSKIEKAPYNKKPLPIMILRHEGDTWENPFALTYESYQGDNQAVIQSTQRLMQDNVFKGVKVSSVIDNRKIEQYILILENTNQTYINEDLGIHFEGTFAIISLTDQRLTDLYIGDGESLSYKDKSLKAFEHQRAYIKL